jgi:hypothetical protein
VSKELEVQMTKVVATEGLTGPGTYLGTPFFEGVMSGLTVRVVQSYESVNGYVKLPDGHPWLEAEDDWDIPSNVHGGITFRDNLGWVGFDTNHGWDIWPDLLERAIPTWKLAGGNQIFWTAEMFMEEMERFAAEAAGAAPKELEEGK